MRILSGIQPSGTIHIGNYFGMIKKMVEFPKLIERPIVVKGKQAVLGRPPENILKLL